MRKKALIVYRDNDSFEKHIPTIRDSLNSLDYDIEENVFPRSTTEEEIKEWYEQNKDELEQDVLADWTTVRSSDYEFNPRINMDTLIGDATEKVLFGGATFEELSRKILNSVWDPSKLEQNLAIEERIAKAIIGRIQRNTDRTIRRMYIVEYFISDHSPFLASAREEAEREGVGGKEVEYQILRAQFDQKYAALIKTWLDGLIESEIVKYPGDLPNDLEEQEECYILYDRHLPEAFLSESKGSLPLPWGDFYGCAIDKFGLRSNLKESENVENYIRQIIQTKLGPRTESK